MAQITKTVAAGDVGIAPFPLSGTDYYDVTFTDNVNAALVGCDGSSSAVWVTTDLTITSVPSAGASTKLLLVPAGMGPSTRDVALTGSAVDTVRILSAGTSTVWVEKE